MDNFYTQETAIPDTEESASSFVETFVYEALDNTEAHLGNLYIVGQIYSNRKRKHNAEFLIEAVSTLKEEYYRNIDRNAFDSFKIALKRTNGFFLKNKKLLSKYSFKVNLLVVLVAENSLFATKVGEGEIFIIREDSISTIDTGSSYTLPKKIEYNFGNIVKGKLEKKDVIIMSTSQVHKLGKDKLIHLSRKKDLVAFINKQKEEFKNLGLISLGLKGRPEQTKNKGPAIEQESPLVKKVHTDRAENVAKVILIVFVLVATLAVSLSALATKKELSEKKNKAAGVISRITILDARVESLVALDNFEEAETTLKEWEEELETLKILDVFKDEIEKQESRIYELTPQVRRYEALESIELINLQKNTIGFVPEHIVYQEGSIVLSSKNILYVFDQTKNTGSFTELPITQDSPINIRSVSSKAESETLLFLSGDKIISYSKNSSSLERRLEELLRDDSLRSALSINFFNDKAYILGNKTIWSLDLENKKLSTWLKNSTLVNPRGFSIDGFIYVLQENSIKKFLNGEKNIDIRIDKNNKALFTMPDFNSLYLLNPKSGLITIMDKFGGISRRIFNKDLEDARSFTIDKDEKTLLFLNKGRVFSISL